MTVKEKPSKLQTTLGQMSGTESVHLSRSCQGAAGYLCANSNGFNCVQLTNIERVVREKGNGAETVSNFVLRFLPADMEAFK